MKICILGWYGTETIGDRAILAGIISLLSQKVENFQIYLGSLYPFYSQRTLQEDRDLYKCFSKKDIEMNTFDTRDKTSLDMFIAKSDIVLMGGGPIMHIEALKMIQYAFEKARRTKKKTMIFGCGIGPIFSTEYVKYTVDILTNSDVIIVRDLTSKQYFKRLIIDLNIEFDLKRILVSFDPAIECAIMYLKIRKESIDNTVETLPHIAINFRDFPSEYSRENNKEFINYNVNEFLIAISKQFSKDKILLIPMHYFHIGSDDREFLNKLVIQNRDILKNVSVQNKPLSLVQTMECFYNAEVSIGMRFHSVVLQTILNGNNYILDYTEPKSGKIYGFIKDIDDCRFYDNRYVNLQKKTEIRFEKDDESVRKKFEVTNDYWLKKRKVYLDAIDLII